MKLDDADFEDGTDVDEKAIDNERVDALETLDQLEQAESSKQVEWVDEGIHDVPVASLPEPEGIAGEDDFQKITAEEMRAGIERLQEMKPAIESGEGANSDYWAEVDAANGLSYSEGYRRVYDAFYGHDAIRIVDNNGELDIVNGRHRIWLAEEMGIETIPARIIRRR